MKSRILTCICAAAVLVASPRLPAAPVPRTAPEEPVVLVASERAVESVGEAVVLVIPVGNGSHFGFVLNQPTETPLAQLFPLEEASGRVHALVHTGGPVLPTGVFAVVREGALVSGQLHRITSELSVALHSGDVDSVIAQRPADARFFMGMMLWMPGQLAGEMAAGAWQVRAAHAETVMTRDPTSLWTRLSERGQHRAAAADEAGPRPALLIEHATPAPDPAVLWLSPPSRMSRGMSWTSAC
jgi:putative transcriptional regulator